jgi:hypothetical protein
MVDDAFSLCFLYKVLIPIMKLQFLGPPHLLKTPPVSSVTLVSGFQQINFGNTQTFRPEQMSVPPTRKLNTFQETIEQILLIHHQKVIPN